MGSSSLPCPSTGLTMGSTRHNQGTGCSQPSTGIERKWCPSSTYLFLAPSVPPSLLHHSTKHFPHTLPASCCLHQRKVPLAELNPGVSLRLAFTRMLITSLLSPGFLKANKHLPRALPLPLCSPTPNQPNKCVTRSVTRRGHSQL